MLSCIWTTSNKPDKLLHLDGWFIWMYDSQTLKIHVHVLINCTIILVRYDTFVIFFYTCGPQPIPSSLFMYLFQEGLETHELQEERILQRAPWQAAVRSWNLHPINDLIVRWVSHGTSCGYLSLGLTPCRLVANVPKQAPTIRRHI